MIHLLAVAALFLLPSVVCAEMFHPAVPIRGVKGDVSVKRPDGSEFARTSDGRACAFGAIVQTGNESSATLILAPDVKAALHPGSTVRVNLAGSRRERAVISLLSGGADIDINKGRLPAGREVELLWQGGSIIFPKQGEFVVDVTESAGVATLALSAAEGSAQVVGAGYSGVIAMEDAGVVLESNMDLSYNRIASTKESFVVTVMTEQGQPREVTIEEEGQIKVYRKELPNAASVVSSILEIHPKGVIVKSESYSQSAAEAQVRSLNAAAMALEAQGLNAGDVND